MPKIQREVVRVWSPLEQIKEKHAHRANDPVRRLQHWRTDDPFASAAPQDGLSCFADARVGVDHMTTD